MRKEKKISLIFALVLLVALLFGSVPAAAGGNHSYGRSLAEARQSLEQELLPLAGAGFVGIAHSEAEGEIIVLVENEQAKQRVPPSFNGRTVRTEVTGKVQTLATQVVEPLANVSEQRLGKVRPLVGGTSLSAYVTKGAQLYLYAGTLGMVTYNSKILSNAHVIAMNPETGDFLPAGTPITQPGTRDGGRLGDRVGALQSYIPINFASNATNYADAAIGSIDVGVNASPGQEFSEGGNYWIEGWTTVSNGDVVRKSGRTTGTTTAQVIHTNVSVVVWYGDRSAYFADQIVVAQDNWSFGAPGDSGSAVDKGGEFVGLLFAGTENHAVICKAKYIVEGLGIAVEPPEGRYSLTISSSEGGSVTQPGEGRFLYDAGTVVNLVAVSGDHCHFVNWTGDVDTIGNPYAASTNITMNSSYSITANFELDEGWYRLDISSTGGGSVITPGEGIFILVADTTLPLAAEPDQGYRFVKWTGDVGTVADIYAASTNITLNASYSITANFETWNEPQALLTIYSTVGGSVTTPGEGAFLYPLGATVHLVAQPDEGHWFVRWSGNVDTVANVTSASATVIVDGPYTIRADFSGGGWCFIATAAYGTPMAGEIQVLREFRDEYMLNIPIGEALVGFYYRVSPPVAEFINQHPGLKPIVRAGLLPVIVMSTIAVNTSPAEKAALMGLAALISVIVAMWAARRGAKAVLNLTAN